MKPILFTEHEPEKRYPSGRVEPELQPSKRSSESEIGATVNHRPVGRSQGVFAC